MKNTWKKRLVALLLTCAMALSLAACAGGGEGDGGTSDGSSVSADGKPFTEETVIKWIIPDQVSWPYRDDWAVWVKFKELCGATFDITTVPMDNYGTKLNLLMAEGASAFPDLIATEKKSHSDSFSTTGAIIAIDDYIDQMPNYTAFWNTFPEEEREERLMQRKAADGKTYYPQVYGADKFTNLRSWMYRKDIFEKHGLEVPTTFEELYQVAKKLKELYPESYPFCLRQGMSNIDIMGSQWKKYMSTSYYYDFANEKWQYGMLDPEMLELVKFMRRMYEEGLIPPEYLTGSTKSWEELMSTDRGFITCEFFVRLDFFNSACRGENPEYTLAAMIPPKGSSAAGTNLMEKENIDQKGIMIMNTGDKERIANAIKLVDWMYTDEAADIVWGVEGVSYEVREDGSKAFIRPGDIDIQAEYGVFLFGTYQRVDPAAADEFASDEQKPAMNLAAEHTVDRYNPVIWLSLTDEEKDQLNTLNDSINSYVTEQFHKYLLCEEPVSTWDSFVKEVENLGVNDALAIYEQAYSRVK